MSEIQFPNSAWAEFNVASVDNVIELRLLLVKPFQAYLFVLWEEAEVEEVFFKDNESITDVYTRAV